MHLLRSVALMGLAGLTGLATADTGLKVDSAGGYWFGPQTRLRLQAMPLYADQLRLGYASDTGLRRAPLAASVTGDYYFSTHIVEPGQARSGFRASSALLIREPGVSLSDVAHASRSVAGFGVPARMALPSLAQGLADPTNYSVSTLPYLGMGYSGVSLKGGWGFWADVGLVVQSPGSAVGFGRVLSGTQGVDDLLRELRMAPMVQLGVNYSF